VFVLSTMPATDTDEGDAGLMQCKAGLVYTYTRTRELVEMIRFKVVLVFPLLWCVLLMQEVLNRNAKLLCGFDHVRTRELLHLRGAAATTAFGKPL